MSVTNQSSNRTLIMNIIFMSVLAVLVLVAQPTLGSGHGPDDMGKNDPEAISQSDGMRQAQVAFNKGEFKTAYDLLWKEIYDGSGIPKTKYQIANAEYLMALSLIGRDGKGQDLVLDDSSKNLDEKAYSRWLHDQATYSHLNRALTNNPNHEGALFEAGMFQVFHDNSKSLYGDKTFKGSLDLLDRLDKLCGFNCGDVTTLEKAIRAAEATTPYVGTQIATAPPFTPKKSKNIIRLKNILTAVTVTTAVETLLKNKSPTE